MPEPRLGSFSPLSKERELGLIDQEITRRQSPAATVTTTSKTDRRLALIDQEIAKRKEAAPKVKERGVIGELAAGFGRGALGVVAAPAEIADIAGEAIGWEALEKAGESGAKAIEKYIKESPKLKRTESISKNILKNPELWKDPRWYSSIVGEGLPTILSMFIPGMAAAKAAKVAKLGAKGVRAARIAGGLTAGVGLEAAGAASDVRQYEEQTGEAIPISTKLQTVLGTGIVAGSLEYVPIFAMFGKAGASKLVGRVLTGMATEGTTEGAQELVANAFAKAGYDADQNMVDGVVESIVGGVLLGGGMGAVSRATNFKERVDETNPEEVSEILEQTETEANIPKEQQTEFTRRREETALRTAEERQAAIEAAAPMTTASDETTTLAEEAPRPEPIVEEIVPEEVVPEEIPLVPGEISAPLRAMGMRPAPAKPAVEKAAVPFMVTKETEAGLSKLGYTKEDIAKMSPKDALGIVEGRIAKEPIIEEKIVAPEVKEIDKFKKLSFSSLGQKTDILQDKIDARHDELDKAGIKWEEQKKDPEITKLYDERIKYDTAAAVKGYDGAKQIIADEIKDLPSKTLYVSTDSILREHYSLYERPITGVYMMSEHTGEALSKDKETIEKVGKDISQLLFARDYPDADYYATMESAVSGLKREGKERYLKEGLVKAKTIHEKIKQFFVPEAKKRELLAPKIEIPTLTDTTQAIAFGKKATPEQKTELKRLRKESEARYDVLIKEDKLDEAGKEALRAQLYREAFEAKEKPKEPAKPVVEKPPKDIYAAMIREEDAKVTAEISDAVKAEREYARIDRLQVEFKETAAKKGYSAQAQDIIFGDIDQLLFDIDKGRINKEAAVSMYEDAVAKKIAIPEKLDKFKQRLLKPAKPQTPKPPKPTPPEAVREEIEVEPIAEVAPKRYEDLQAAQKVVFDRAVPVLDTGRNETGWGFIEDINLQGQPSGTYGIINKSTGEIRYFKSKNTKIAAENLRASMVAKDYAIENRTIEKPVPEKVEYKEPKPKKEPKVEAPIEKVPTKPEPGFAWIKGKQKPILSAREIAKGKNKGKYEVILTKGRDAEGNIIPGAKKIVTEKEIITMPEAIVEEKIEVAPIEKAKVVKPVIPGVKPKVGKDYIAETMNRGSNASVLPSSFRATWEEEVAFEDWIKDNQPLRKALKGWMIENKLHSTGSHIGDLRAFLASKGYKGYIQISFADYLDDIRKGTPLEEKKIKPIEEAKSRIKTSTTEILKGERGSFSTKTKEGAATFEDFSIVGKDFVRRGADTFAKFTEQMKKTFGEVWESVKHLAKKLYTRAKAILTEERGEITIREEQPIPLKEEPKVKKLTPAEKAKEAFKVLGIKPRLKPEEPLPKRARSVGLAYQDISEEAKRLEVEMGLEYPKVTRTHAELREQADRIMGDQEQLIKTMEKEKNFTEAEGLVVRRAAATGLESLMKVVATKDIKKANEIHKEFKEGVGKQVQDLHSEFGRNLESLKEKVSPESMSKAFASLERDLNKDDMDMFNSAAEALGQGNAKPMINFQKYLKTTKQDPKIMDYVYEYWYNSILSGVPTHVVNIASNTAWGAWQVGVHKPLLAAIDPLIAKFQKRPTEYYMAEIIPALAGIKRGLKPGIKGAKEVIVKGYTTDAELDKFAADMGSSVGAFARSPNKHLRTIAPFLTMPTRALRAMDIWAKQMNYESELGSVAKRMEKKGEGKYEELLKNPTKDMMNEASQYADYTTFMEKLGKIGTMVEKLRTAVPGGRFIVPFVRTIANLVKRGVEMTPGVGAMKLLGGKVKGKEVTQVLAKQIEGAMIALVIASMFGDDEITGDVPANKAEREAFYRQGKKPWAIKIGDRWYQYRRIEPFNTPVAAVGILYDTWKRTGEEPSTEFAYRSAAGFVNNIIDSSYLSGLTQVLDSVRKADKWPQKLTNMFDKTLASFSPMSSFQRSFVRAIEAIDKEGAILRKPKGAVETVAAATPFLSEMVPARKDVWGKEIMIAGTPLEQWLPWKTAKETDDVVEIEIERLHGAGLMSYPGMPAKYMSIGGKRLDLDDEQFDTLITESGQASKKKLDSLVGTKYWGMLSDKEKASRIQKIIKDNRKKARNKIKKKLKVAIPGMVPWKKTKKKKRPAWQETTFGKKAGWQKPMEF